MSCHAAPRASEWTPCVGRRLSEVGELSASQVAKGVARTRDSLDDLALDNPAAKERYGQLMELVE